MKIISALAGLALASIVASAASSNTLTITDVETGNPDLGNVSVAGYGSPWTTPILFTDSHGNTMVVFCDDLNHTVNVGGGQSLPYMTALVTVNGLGQPLSKSTSNKMGQLADIGKYDYSKGNEDGAIAAQAAIWGLEYNVPVTSTDATIQADITNFLQIQDNGRGFAAGLVPTDGNSTQSQITGGVPEPSTWAMMLLGFAGLGFAGYRRTKKAPRILSAA